MTVLAAKEHRKLLNGAFTCVVFFSFLFVILKFSSEMRASIIDAVRLSVNVIVPSLFPFMILSDFLTASLEVKEKSILSRCFERLFGISGAGLSAFISGCVCGFPLGIRSAVRLYEDGRITKSDLERLSAIANNPSLAFAVTAVGVGMRGSIAEGLRLYSAVIFSAVLVGIFFRQNGKKIENSHIKQEQNFVLSDSIKSAGFALLSISSYIIFFSALLSVVKILTKSEAVFLLIAPFFEISTACKLLSEGNAFSAEISLILTAFSLAFSGFSVHMQGFSFLPREVSRARYLGKKLLQGIIAAVLILLLSFI